MEVNNSGCTLFYPALCTERKCCRTQETVSQPTLAFSGTTALCEFKIVNVGKAISVTMELWNGTTLVDSWTKTGVSVVSLSEECAVVSGRTYTLKASGTVGNEAFTATPVSKRCP